MEAFGAVVSRPIPSFSGGREVEPQPRNASSLGFFYRAAVGTQRNLRPSGKSLKVSCFSNFVFSDQRYMDYYSSGRKIRCGACKEKVKGEKEMMKERLKKLKNLSRELALLSRMDSCSDNVLVDPLNARMISEAAELLEGQLQQLRSEEKKLKQRRKEEKSRLKAAKMQKMLELQLSTSSSSESSDCGQVVDMNLLNCNPPEKHIPDATQPIPDNETSALPGTFMPQERTPDDLPEGNLAVGTAIKTCCNSRSLEQGLSSRISNSSGDGAGFTRSQTPAAKKIEVCMGGKCKKSGAVLLMEKFQRALGIEASVSGCKCMGKCRNGPNVRISHKFDDDNDMEVVLAQDGVKPSTDHLCTGVGLEDVDLIVENFFKRSQEKLELVAASH